MLMVVACLGMVRRTRYDLIHAVEESAFIASAMQALSGVPYVYDMDSSLAEQMVEAYPALGFVFPAFRRMEALAVRRSIGVLTVCAALEDIALAHDPGKPVGRVEDTTLLADGEPDGRERPHPSRNGRRPGRDVRRQSRAAIRGSISCSRASATRCSAVPEAQLVIVGGREDDIARYRARAERPGHRLVGRVHGTPADRRCCPACCGRRTCWCRPGSRGSTPR